MDKKIAEIWYRVLGSELKRGDYVEAFQTAALLAVGGHRIQLTSEQYAILILESNSCARKYGAYINWNLISIID